MTERQMRQVIEEVLTHFARKVVLPASLGVGLALSGCESRAVPVQGDGASKVDARPVARYATPFPGSDAGTLKPDRLVPPPQADYVAPFPEPDAAIAPPVALYSAVMHLDAGSGFRYGTPFPPADAG